MKQLLNYILILTLALFGVSAISEAQEHELVQAEDGSGVIGYKDTPIQPWSGYHVHDPDRPAPERITPGQPGRQEQAGTAPSDAVVLFDGTDLSHWEPSEWKIENGELIATEGVLRTRQEFGDMQLHLEWRTPDPPQGDQFNRGNNGVNLMGLYEIQIFDSYTEKLYPDGQAAAVYAQTPPLVNACRAPGAWQSYDIIFSAPVYKVGKLVEPARVTVLHNGVVVHHNQKIYGETGHRILPYYQTRVEKGPLELLAHNNPVRFRNIWVRPLGAE